MHDVGLSFKLKKHLFPCGGCCCFFQVLLLPLRGEL